MGGVLRALGRGEPPTPAALRLLLRAYAANGREDVRAAIEPALARSLELAADSSSTDAAGWLILFAEAADASDDPRVRYIASNLASTVRMNWGGAQPIAVSAESVEAFLSALPLLPDATAQAPIDELERLASSSYQPGSGMAETFDSDVSMASALLTAFAVTDRLPYAMLAEELLHHASASLSSGALSFQSACRAANALSRLAALHRHAGYRATAVVSPEADYYNDAAGLLERIAEAAETSGLAGAEYGLAAGELQSAFRWL